jgi:hypothetical protein
VVKRPIELPRRGVLQGALSATAAALLGGCRSGVRAESVRAPAATAVPLCADVAPAASGLPSIPAVRETLDDVLREVPTTTSAAVCEPMLPSFYLAGFEASNHLRNGVRLDLTASTRHDHFAELDYERLVSVGMRGARDGISWPETERRAGTYDFSRAIAMARAARRAGVTVMWELMHYGWPLDLDIFSTAFPRRFARYAKAFARTFADEGLVEPGMIVTLVNEISFLAWAGGDVAMLNPYRHERSWELKLQLVRAAIEGARAVREVIPSARFLHVDPLMHVAPRTSRPREVQIAEQIHLFQYQAVDMVTGRTMGPQLGGAPDLVDILGVNYYRDNQRFLDGEQIEGRDLRYRPLSEMLLEVFRRYGKPMILAETGAEDDSRAPWLRYVSVEVAKAMRAGCALHGITWYPIVNHPGWADDRHVHNGLWDYPDRNGRRVRHDPLAEEIARTTPTLTKLHELCVLRMVSSPRAAHAEGARRVREPR